VFGLDAVVVLVLLNGVVKVVVVDVVHRVVV